MIANFFVSDLKGGAVYPKSVTRFDITIPSQGGNDKHRDRDKNHTGWRL
jgi:hypothetical protein